MTDVSELKKLYPDELSAGGIEYTQVNVPYRSLAAMKENMDPIGVGVLREVPPYAAVKLSEKISKLTNDLSPVMRAQKNIVR